MNQPSDDDSGKFAKATDIVTAPLPGKGDDDDLEDFSPDAPEVNPQTSTLGVTDSPSPASSEPDISAVEAAPVDGIGALEPAGEGPVFSPVPSVPLAAPEVDSVPPTHQDMPSPISVSPGDEPLEFPPLTVENPPACTEDVPAPDPSPADSSGTDGGTESTNHTAAVSEKSGEESTALEAPQQSKSMSSLSSSRQKAVGPAAAAKFEPGQVWAGKFEIECLLGSGGMGKVFKAMHLQISAPVALKVMDSAIGTDRGTSRFMREARLLSAVNHVNVVRLLAFGQTADRVLYMALEFINGQALSDVLSQQILKPTRAVGIAQQICRGLEAAHNAGIIHRDLKPSNILLTQDEKGLEVVKIIDFGIARLADDLEKTVGDVEEESTSSVIGTPYYMSPEQCTGKKLVFASDIYSVGCLLYEMLCGQPPFPSEVPYTVMQGHINERLENVPSKHPVPTSLEALVLKCLEKDPGDRFASAAELEAELSRINWDTLRISSKPKTKTNQERTGQSKLVWALAALLVVIPPAANIIVQRLSTDPDKLLRPQTKKNTIRGINLSDEQRIMLMQRSPTPAERVAWYRDWLSKKSDKPDSSEAYFYLAQDLSDSGGSPSEVTAYYKEAAKRYKSAIEKELAKAENERNYNDLVPFILRWCNSLERIGERAEALQNLSGCLEKLSEGKCPSPKMSQLLQEAARLTSITGNAAKAEQLSKEAEDVLTASGLRGEELSSARLTHAMYLFQTGQRDAALVKIGEADTSRKADRKDPSRDDFSWPLHVANSYVQMQSFTLALEKYKEAETLIPPGFLTMEVILGKVGTMMTLEHWSEARDSLKAAVSTSGAKLQDYEIWKLLELLTHILASGRTDGEVDQLIKEKLSSAHSEAAIQPMVSTACNLIKYRKPEVAAEILERALHLFRETAMRKGKLDDSEQLLAIQMADLLLCAKRFDTLERFAEEINSCDTASVPGTNEPPSALMNIYCRNAVALSHQSNKKRDGLMRIKAAVDRIAIEPPQAHAQLRVQALLDRAMVQFNLNTHDENMWLTWACEAAKSANLQIEMHKFLTNRIMCSLCNRNPLLADEICEAGQQLYSDNPALLNAFNLECGDRYLSMGRYDRAVDLLVSCVKSGYTAGLPASAQRGVLISGIRACEKAGSTDNLGSLKKQLDEIKIPQ